MTKGLTAWYFSGRDKLEGGLFAERPPYCTVTLVVGGYLSRDPEAETTHMLSPPPQAPEKTITGRTDGPLPPKVSHYWYPYRFRYDRDALWIAAPRKIEPKHETDISNIQCGRASISRPDPYFALPASSLSAFQFPNQDSNSGAG
jgi:hypothetical protein